MTTSFRVALDNFLAGRRHTSLNTLRSWQQTCTIRWLLKTPTVMWSRRQTDDSYEQVNVSWSQCSQGVSRRFHKHQLHLPHNFLSNTFMNSARFFGFSHFRLPPTRRSVRNVNWTSACRSQSTLRNHFYHRQKSWPPPHYVDPVAIKSKSVVTSV